jgi:tripartite-type tricarboxylate transporter receptor subunit TctC
MITRRILLLIVAVAAMGAAAVGEARAQTYPDKLIKMIVPAPPGGQTDVLARFLAQRMEAALGKSVIVDNRGGAGGAIGARAAAAADPDGYTIFFGNTSTLAVIPAVSKKPGYDPDKNFAPVASVSESYMILVVHPSFPGKTIQEFLAYAKANPGKLNFGNAGAGNVTHLTGEMFRSMAGIDFLNVPFKGGAESITSLLGEQVHFLFESPVVLLPLIREGKLRALAVTAAKRQPGAEDIPTLAESGLPNFAATLLTGVVAPAGTPPAAVARLNAVINEILGTEQMKATLARFGSTPNIGSAAEFTKFLAGEKAKWGGVAQKAGVSIE